MIAFPTTQLTTKLIAITKEMLLEGLTASDNNDGNITNKIEIYGDDQYDIALSSNVIDEDDIILAFGIDGEPLDEECKPVRVIIPESDSAYWIRMVNRIEFTK